MLVDAWKEPQLNSTCRMVELEHDSLSTNMNKVQNDSLGANLNNSSVRKESVSRGTNTLDYE